MIKNIWNKFLTWLIGLFNKLKADIQKVKEIESKTVIDVVKVEQKAISDLQEGEKFVCHYCNLEFALLAKNIFPVSVRVLYQDNYVIGKGVLCPHCGQTCITG
jgi:DNA-directed RNA polymerase subunit RPC12/RpoP